MTKRDINRAPAMKPEEIWSPEELQRMRRRGYVTEQVGGLLAGSGDFENVEVKARNYHHIITFEYLGQQFELKVRRIDGDELDARALRKGVKQARQTFKDQQPK